MGESTAGDSTGLVFTLVRAEPLLIIVSGGASRGADPSSLAWDVLEWLAVGRGERVRESLRLTYESQEHGALIIERDPQRPVIAVLRADELDAYLTGVRLVAQTVPLRAPRLGRQ